MRTLKTYIALLMLRKNYLTFLQNHRILWFGCIRRLCKNSMNNCYSNFKLLSSFWKNWLSNRKHHKAQSRQRTHRSSWQMSLPFKRETNITHVSFYISFIFHQKKIQLHSGSRLLQPLSPSPSDLPLKTSIPLILLYFQLRTSNLAGSLYPLYEHELKILKYFQE